MTKREFKASSVESAIEAGLSELGIDRENADIEIISQGGFLKKAIVAIGQKAEVKIEAEAEAEEMPAARPAQQKREDSEAKTYIQRILSLMRLSCSVEERIRNDEIAFYVKGEDAHKVIGYRGETLDALQHLMTCKVNGAEKLYERVVVDADFYRQKREQTLVNLARRLARQAANAGEDMPLEPMNAFERRIIHSALQGSRLAGTRSEGEGKDRHIIIYPLEKNAERDIQYGSTGFNKTGPKKTKSYGYSRRRF